MVGKKIYLNEEQSKSWKEQPRETNGKFAKKKNWKLVAYIWLIAGTLSIANYGLEKYVDWRNNYDVVYKFPIQVITHKIIEVVKRPEPQLLNPVVVETIEQSDIKVESPIDQKIYDLWGDRYFLLARSVFKCESGLRVDAVNWGSKDIGVAQINWPIWEKTLKEKFNYTLVDLFDPMKNLEVAYYIWDRADGTEGDNKGSFEPWVIFQNGAFVGCVE